MKKNVMMRAASALLVAVLLTTSAISGTFAKYTTSTTGSDSARVAYWGFKQDATITFNLFDKTYNNAAGDKTVEAAVDVIAPGTSSETSFAFGYAKNGAIAAPEVAYELTVTPNITGNYTALDNNPNFKWILQAPGAAAVEYNKVADLLAAITALSGDASGTKEYAAGQLPDAFKDTAQTYKIGWEWDFETTGAGEAAQDAVDTAMGNADDLSDVTFEITIAATQID